MRCLALVRRASDLALVRSGAALGSCTAITLAPDGQANPLLAAARAAGAERAIQLWDPALESVDYLGLATALAAIVRTVADPGAAPTLVLSGDRGRAAVGPALAERLQLPLLAQVTAVELDGGRILARRRFRGVIKLYAATPPALVALIVDEEATLEPAADKRGIERWTLERVGLTAAELTYRRRFLPHASPGPERAPRRLADVKALAARLRADGLLPPTDKP